MKKLITLATAAVALSLFGCSDGGGGGGSGGSGLSGDCASATLNDCDANATCADTAASHTCTCDAGWEGTGQVCTDINECTANTDDCVAPATCLNTDGAWACPIYTTVSGVLNVHPISGAVNAAVVAGGGTALDWGNAGDVVVMLFDPVAILGAGGDISGLTPLGADMDLTDNSDGAGGTGCAFDVNNPSVPNCLMSFTNVDVSGLSLGLIALIIDNRVAPQFAPTNAGIFGAGTVVALKADPTPGYPTAFFQAVSLESLDTVATIAGTTGAAALTQGAMFGMMLSARTPAPGLSPVSGIVITEPTGATTITYPDAALAGTTAATDAYGFFFAVSNAAAPPAAVIAPWIASQPDDSPGGLHVPLTAGTNPGTVFVLNWVAESACDAYCTVADTNCAGANALTWTPDCATECAALATGGTTGNPAGDTLGCRIYHLTAAAGDPALHCPHGTTASTVCIP